jgi:Fe-S-cluster formation regulator IscX/YfhJ
MEKANISKLGANFQNLNIKVDPSEYVIQFERLTQSISKLEEMEDRQRSKIKGL